MSIGDRKKILKKRSCKLKAKLSPRVKLINDKKGKKKAALISLGSGAGLDFSADMIV